MLLSDTVERKFVESVKVPDFMKISVLSDTGYVPVTHSNQTVEYEVYQVEFESGRQIECADTHIFITSENEEVFAKDSIQSTMISVDGVDKVSSVTPTGQFENMYDLTVDSESHTYFTNGILSHNTTLFAADILHDVIFNPDFRVGITSYKNSAVLDFLDRIRYAYEGLPWWLKPAVQIYNRFSIVFDNGSSIRGEVTAENTFRGKSLNRIISDELAFTKPAIADAFIASLLPSLEAEGEASTTRFNVISTPNGTEGAYPSMWFGAVAGTNGFYPVEVKYEEIPGRTPEFEEKMVKKIGRDKFDQEYRCVSGDTKLTVVRHFEPEEMTIGGIFESLHGDDDFKNNHDFKVLSTDGMFVNFDGVLKTVHDKYVHVSFLDGSHLDCALEHQILTSGGFVQAQDIVPDDVCNGKLVDSIEIKEGPIELYDLVNCDNQQYMTNGVISHNCVFIGSGGTLVNSRIMEAIKTVDPIETLGDLDIYVDDFKGRKLAIACDVAEGINEDNHVMQVFDIDTMEQVAEFANNNLPQTLYFKEIVKTIKYFYSRGASEIFYTVENNGLGNGVMRLIENSDDNALSSATLISDLAPDGTIGKRLGMMTTGKSKLAGCMQLKDMIELNKIKINSRKLLSELKFFVRSGASFAAESGMKDDRVMACVVFCNMLPQLATYEDSVDQIINDVNEDEEVWGICF